MPNRITTRRSDITKLLYNFGAVLQVLDTHKLTVDFHVFSAVLVHVDTPVVPTSLFFIVPWSEKFTSFFSPFHINSYLKNCIAF